MGLFGYSSAARDITAAKPRTTTAMKMMPSFLIFVHPLFKYIRRADAARLTAPKTILLRASRRKKEGRREGNSFPPSNDSSVDTAKISGLYRSPDSGRQSEPTCLVPAMPA